MLFIKKADIIISEEFYTLFSRSRVLISYTDDVKIVSSFHKNSNPYGKIESRLTHGFIFRTQGKAEYFINGKRIQVNAGEAIFLPKGSAYEYRTEQISGTLYTSINFEANFENPKISVYPTNDFYGTSYITDSFSELWKFGTKADKFKCLSIFYDFLAYVMRLDTLKEEDKTKHNIIEKAIEYLKKNIYSSDLKIANLHSICGISDTYFRKIFKERFNMSPQKYVLYERIAHAKSILESGDFYTVREVALSVGYNDALYFSKAFKKVFGFSPSDINT